MYSHAKNSFFQYAYFMAGKCHTADEAYRVLSDQLEDRALALGVSESTRLRAEAKRLRAEDTIAAGGSDADVLEAKADIAEQKAHEAQTRACIEGCAAEVEFLKQLIAALQPHRKYAHLSDHDAGQACQREEWCLELKHRAENYFLSSGNIPADQIDAMRAHPDFDAEIVPHLEACRLAMRSGQELPSTRKVFLEAIADTIQPYLPEAAPQLRLV